MRARNSSLSGSWPLFTDKGENTQMKHQHSNSTTDFDRGESLSVGAERQKAPGFSVSFSESVS